MTLTLRSPSGALLADFSPPTRAADLPAVWQPALSLLLSRAPLLAAEHGSAVVCIGSQPVCIYTARPEPDGRSA